MSSTMYLCWNLLTYKGKLPDELILKIAYEFEGIQHPLVKLLFNDTKIDEYERLRRLPFSKTIQRHYYKYGCDDELMTLLINKQKHYFMNNCRSYTMYENPSYFIPRQKGRLYYSVLNDNLPIERFTYVNFKLNRSKKMIKSIKCMKCGKLYINDLEHTNDYDNYYEKYGSYTKMLMTIEQNKDVNEYLCRYCYDVAFNHSKLN